MSDIRVCRDDGEPLVSTMEFAGAEFVCAVCGGTEGIFGLRANMTPERVLRLSELTEVYERDRAKRRDVEYRPPPKVGDDGVEVPVCGGCGATPPVGATLPHRGKPSAWFARERDGVTQYACSKACIPDREDVLPW